MEDIKMDIQKVKEKINLAKVVSFDVFDTLLFRITSSPEVIFDLTGEKFGIDNYRNLRMKSQQEISRIVLKSGKAPHADINEIYTYISEKNPGYDWDKVKNFELDIEKASVIRNSEIYEIYQYAVEHGKRIIAVSDMYLDGYFIEELIKQCGYVDIQKVYCSANLKKTKYEQTIFEEVAKREKVRPEEIIHIGDNQKSDVELAKKSGWDAIWYDTEQQTEHRPGSFAGLGKKLHKNASFWYLLGGDIAGNLYVNLYRWLQKQQHKYECDKICFLARDGYNMYQICKKVNESHVIYLEMSRRSLLLAGITELDDESLKLLPPYALGQTIAEILNYLGIDEGKCEYIPAGFQNSQDVIINDELRERMKHFFKVNEKIVLEACEKEREYAKQYFEKKGVLDSKVLYFDCGWNGSSQFLLKRFYRALGKKKEVPFVYVGIMDTEKSRKQLNGLPYSTYLFGIEKNPNIAKELKKAIVIPELFFGAPHPSVWYYGENGEVVYEKEEMNKQKEEIAKGIEDYFNHIYPFIEKYEICISGKEIVTDMQRLIDAPSKREAVMIGNIENADGFVKQKNLKKYIARLDMSTIRKYPRIEIYWKKGLLKRPDISFGVKLYVVLKEAVKNILKSVR